MPELNKYENARRLQLFWEGKTDSDEFKALEAKRNKNLAETAEAQGKQVTYIPNDGSGNLPEVTISAQRPKQKALWEDWTADDYIDAGITVAGFIPGADTFADIADIGNSWRKGDTAGMLWGLAGLGLPVSGKVLKNMFGFTKDSSKRLKEVAMRIGPNENPIQLVGEQILTSKPKNYKDVFNYIRTGKKLSNGQVPRIGVGSNYNGILTSEEGNFEGDIIDAIIYNIPLSKRFGDQLELTEQNVGIPLYKYISKNYPNKVHQVMQTEPEKINVISSQVFFGGEGSIPLKDGSYYDSAGHNIQLGRTKDWIPVTKSRDIYKFKPEDYAKRYGIKKILMPALRWVDKDINPVVITAPWKKMSDTKVKITGDMPKILIKKLHQLGMDRISNLDEALRTVEFLPLGVRKELLQSIGVQKKGGKL